MSGLRRELGGFPLDHKIRIHQSIARELGTAILSGRYSPGDPLPGEIEHSATLGVSRTPYREAIRILTAKGLLESRPKAGTRITARDRWNVLDPDILAWMFMGTPDPNFIRDLFELRGILEPAAARLAADRRSPAHVSQMRAALEVTRRYGFGSVEGQAADQDFHRVLLEATGNLALASLASSVGAAVRWTTFYKQRASASPRNPLADHEAVFDAIEAMEPAAAARTMSDLIGRAYDDMNTVR